MNETYGSDKVVPIPTCDYCERSVPTCICDDCEGGRSLWEANKAWCETHGYAWGAEALTR